MALKNRDGTEFKLNRPNPIMAEQKIWKKGEKLIFHNKIGKIVTLLDEETEPARIADFTFDTQTLAKTKEVLQPTEPVIVRQLEEQEAGSTEDDKIQVWCLPASYKEYTDNLYGEKYRKVKYGNKFLLEAIALEQDDLSFTMWTNTKAVTEGSILFPRTYDKRWWRVQRVKEQDEGYVAYCIISDYQPKFSD